MKKILTLVAALWKIFVGALVCQSPVTSILAIGWAYRAMQRRALRVWKDQSPTGDTRGVVPAADPLFLAHESWPNWFLQPAAMRSAEKSGARPGLRAGLRRRVRSVTASFTANLRIGLLGAFNTSAAMLVPAMLWQIGWYAGWDNSFNKGYEQYYTGIVLSLIGIFLFLPIMLYLPMAQARQAVTGNWRAFWDLRTVWAVTRNAPIRVVLLASAYSLLSLPIFAFLSAPQFLEKIVPATAAMSDAELIEFLKRYYFRLALYGFPAYVFVRWLAAGVYARTIVELLHTGRLTRVSLAGAERHALAILQLDAEGRAAKLHPAIAVTLALSRPVWRAAVLGGAIVIWFTFVAQIYVREFLAYHPVQGFMNQPLVQLPWFRYIPGQLERSVQAAQSAAPASGENSEKAP